jgi:hypothetical protein
MTPSIPARFSYIPFFSFLYWNCIPFVDHINGLSAAGIVGNGILGKTAFDYFG